MSIAQAGDDILKIRWFVVGICLLAYTPLAQTAEGESPKPLTIAKEPGSNFDASNFAAGQGRELVIANCTACHSDKLVTQNRSDSQGWRELINWMQKKQGLWPLDPKTEDAIVEYLATYYGRPQVADDTRRPALPEHLMPPIPSSPPTPPSPGRKIRD